MAGSAELKPDGARSSASHNDVLQALRARGGTASRRQLAQTLNAPVWQLARRLRELVERGAVERVGQGAYRLSDSPDEYLGGSAAEIVRAITESGAEAHLTGLDPVAAHSRQFLRSFPHVVYVDPAALEHVAFALAQAGFQPVLAGRGARNTVAHSPDPDRIVVLRGQSASRMDRLGVRSEVAPPEKAWLDLLRESRNGVLPFTLNDVGAVLTSMVQAGADTRQLLRWAREMGYERQAQAALDPASARDAEDEELRKLAAGARS